MEASMDGAFTDPVTSSQSARDTRSPGRARLRCAAYGFVLVALLLDGGAAPAQEDARVKAGLDTWQRSGCTDCHGPFADGNRDDDDYPQGADLRTTRLDATSLEMTIRCGRPGTGMPSFDAGAYTERACYGRALGARPDNLQPTPRPLSLDEIGTLIAYLEARIVGHGRPTREECLAYYGGSANCDDIN